jgi:aspartyl/glutamyl-tRNA(Asn/Gln) amidotransferase C subunit
MKEQFLNFLETSSSQIQSHKQIALDNGVNKDAIELHDKLIDYCSKLKYIVQNTELTINYVNNFQVDIKQALKCLPYIIGNTNLQLHHNKEQNKEQIKSNIEKQKDNLSKRLESLRFNLDFFKKLDFFSDNIVAIGANGSGKTTLSDKLKQYLPKSSVVISAQRILLIPTFDGVSNFNQTDKNLKQTQQADKSMRNTFSMTNKDWFNPVQTLAREFGNLIANLFAERNVQRNEYVNSLPEGSTITITKPKTKLDAALEIWNFLIQHRVLECSDDGSNLTLKTTSKTTSGENYPAHQMSDGEKVALYLIAQVLQAPKNGFIIADEPEMHLHKAILEKLWDRLEQERRDCIFIYLTHDLDFATSRNAKKVWIKSYTPPEKWDIEGIPKENELPEQLLMELFGSRKSILFCEGERDGIDYQIYKILFHKYTITPVRTCRDVINYTKAFNKLPNIVIKASGIIDSDYHSARLDALKCENIFALPVAEIENLLLDEKFLELAAREFKVTDDKAVDNIKQGIMQEFEKNLELQVSNYVSAKIDCHFKDSHLNKGNNKKEIKDKFDNFVNEIKICDWHSQRQEELKKIIESKDYSKVLAVYNNKGLKKIVNDRFEIKNFTERVVKLLQSNKEAQEIIRKKLPEDLKWQDSLRGFMLKEELETTAFLARIDVKEDEKEKYLADINGMFDYIEILQEPDVTELNPTTHVTELRNVWREDVVKSCPREVIDQMLNGSPLREGTFYKIQKVIA